MKNERSGRRVINESWDRKSSRDHRSSLDRTSGGHRAVSRMQYVRYVILERGKKNCIYHGG